MAKLKDKIDNALNETRILVLGIQILIGFAFRSFFEPGFAKMSPKSQQLAFVALAMMLMGLVVLIVPVPFHRITLQGRNTSGLQRLATSTVSVALLPFAVSMALSFFVAIRWVVGALASAVAAGAILGITLFFWYGMEIAARRRKRGELHLYAALDPLRDVDMNQEEHTELSTRVKEVLIECRVVLPGAQALLGFQLIIMWMTDFQKIPQSWKLLHLASLSSIAVCTILLITPAAYHRIVEQGEDSEALIRVTDRALLWAMAFLGLGICGDFYVVSRRTGFSSGVSSFLTLTLLALCFGSWFGYSAWRARETRAHRRSPNLEHHPAA